MFSKSNNQKGFTLIELLIVLVIIGILFALAVPRFQRATTRSRQAEAKDALKGICNLQQTYRQEHDCYWTSSDTASVKNPEAFAKLGFTLNERSRYSYTITAGCEAFTATAFANVDSDSNVDTWTITQDAGEATCAHDDSAD